MNDVSIIFENDSVLVINKPAGLVVHPDGKRDEYSLVDWILENYPDMKSVGEPLKLEYKGENIIIDRPGIVHRLDRETSGVMILAKTQDSYEHLKNQFIVSGWIEDRGIINTPIGRHSNDIRLWTTGRGARGQLRDAVTRYSAQKKFVDEAGNKYTLVRLFPETGRTHQLRVHMKSIHHAIIGDGLYASKTVGTLGFNRTALHAQKITFKDVDGKDYAVEAPTPEDFEKVLQA